VKLERTIQDADRIEWSGVMGLSEVECVFDLEWEWSDIESVECMEWSDIESVECMEWSDIECE